MAEYDYLQVSSTSGENVDLKGAYTRVCNPTHVVVPSKGNTMPTCITTDGHTQQWMFGGMNMTQPEVERLYTCVKSNIGAFTEYPKLNVVTSSNGNTTAYTVKINTLSDTGTNITNRMVNTTLEQRNTTSGNIHMLRLYDGVSNNVIMQLESIEPVHQSVSVMGATATERMNQSFDVSVKGPSTAIFNSTGYISTSSLINIQSLLRNQISSGASIYVQGECANTSGGGTIVFSTKAILSDYTNAGKYGDKYRIQATIVEDTSV